MEKREEALKKAGELIVRMYDELRENGCHSVSERELREIAQALQ